MEAAVQEKPVQQLKVSIPKSAKAGLLNSALLNEVTTFSFGDYVATKTNEGKWSVEKDGYPLCHLGDLESEVIDGAIEVQRRITMLVQSGLNDICGQVDHLSVSFMDEKLREEQAHDRDIQAMASVMKPFADLYKGAHIHRTDDEVVFYTQDAPVTVGDIRKASALYHQAMGSDGHVGYHTPKRTKGLNG